MTPFERQIIRYVELRGGTVNWGELRGQFVVSEGYLTVVINSLKRQLLIFQDRLSYRLSSLGEAALTPQRRRPAFEGRAVW